MHRHYGAWDQLNCADEYLPDRYRIAGNGENSVALDELGAGYV
jgi:hypothetical protein